MITIISSTNQRSSNTLRVSEQVLHYFHQHMDTGEEIRLLSLEDLPGNMIHPEMYSRKGQAPEVSRMQDDYIIPSTKYYFVIPEYNGSIPGVLKTFIDACSVRDYKGTFMGKKAAMIGISSGRAGNLRGMEHLTGILNFLGIAVMPNKLPISRIETLVDNEGYLSDMETPKGY
jgi:chromate reductase